MKIRVLSDLHLEFYDDPYPAGIFDDIDCDVVVLAGDIHSGLQGIEWAADTFSTPVIYVMGNHEYYGRDADVLLARARKRAAELGVHLLEKDEITIAGTRFLGCTLWSDFEGGGRSQLDNVHAAQSVLADFKAIVKDGALLTPSTMIDWFTEAKDWLGQKLESEIPAVVVTHFAPSWQVVNPKFGVEDANTAYFNNNLEELMGNAVPVWIFGHHHWSMSKTIETPNGKTLVTANQLGYPREETNFQADYVISTPS